MTRNEETVSEMARNNSYQRLEVTDMANASTDNGYPFATRAEIKERLDAGDDTEFALDALLILDGRQVDVEREQRETIFKNRVGWMSSHAVWGSRLASKHAMGETLTDEEMGRVHGMVCRYSRQLAAHFRMVAKAQTPELASKGEVFGV